MNKRKLQQNYKNDDMSIIECHSERSEGTQIEILRQTPQNDKLLHLRVLRAFVVRGNI